MRARTEATGLKRLEQMLAEPKAGGVYMKMKRKPPITMKATDRVAFFIAGFILARGMPTGWVRPRGR